MPTKAELEIRINALENDVRRMNRALGQAHLDLDATVSIGFNHTVPAISEQAREAIKRAQSEWSAVVIDPCQRIDTYIRSTQGLDRKSTRLNSSHPSRSRMPSSA